MKYYDTNERKLYFDLVGSLKKDDINKAIKSILKYNKKLKSKGVDVQYSFGLAKDIFSKDKTLVKSIEFSITTPHGREKSTIYDISSTQALLKVAQKTDELMEQWCPDSFQMASEEIVDHALKSYEYAIDIHSMKNKILFGSIFVSALLALR